MNATQALSRTERLMRELRSMPLFRQLVAMEAGIGWPIPVRKARPEGAALVCMRLPLFGFRPMAETGKGAVLYPPFATVTLRWDNGRPVEYVDLDYTRPWPMPADPEPVGTFPHDALRGSRGDYLRHRGRLLELYDDLFSRLQDSRGFEAGWIEEFSTLLRSVVEPGLEPYFRVLGSQFYERFLGPAPSPPASGDGSE